MNDDVVCENIFCNGQAKYVVMKPGTMQAAYEATSESKIPKTSECEIMRLCERCYRIHRRQTREKSPIEEPDYNEGWME